MKGVSGIMPTCKRERSPDERVIHRTTTAPWFFQHVCEDVSAPIWLTHESEHNVLDARPPGKTSQDRQDEWIQLETWTNEFNLQSSLDQDADQSVNVNYRAISTETYMRTLIAHAMRHPWLRPSALLNRYENVRTSQQPWKTIKIVVNTLNVDHNCDPLMPSQLVKGRNSKSHSDEMKARMSSGSYSVIQVYMN